MNFTTWINICTQIAKKEATHTNQCFRKFGLGSNYSVGRKYFLKFNYLYNSLSLLQ